MDNIKVNLLAAVAANGVIGKYGRLPWNIPRDLEWFSRETKHSVCLVGRKTFEHLPRLPNRTLVILTGMGTTFQRYDARGNVKDYEFFEDTDTFAAALARAKLVQAQAHPECPVMIIGGENIYRQALQQDVVDTMYITHVQQTPDGDRHFPRFNLQAWGLNEIGQAAAYADVPGWSRVAYNRRRSEPLVVD